MKSLPIAVTHPVLAAEWDSGKNSDVLISEVSAGSGRKVWWKCKKGHSWESSVYSRAGKQSRGCPFCSNQRVWVGFNDLKHVHPDVAEQWHPTKNGVLQPDQVVAKAGRRVWWLCLSGHEWEARVSDRQRFGCPYCAGRLPVQGETDLMTTHPDLCAQWHPTKNVLSPEMVSAGSGRKVWWLGECGHEWEGSVQKRAGRGDGCPFCSHRKVITGLTDLASTKPEAAAQWHPTKNGDVKPEGVFSNHNKPVWWQCAEGHEWEVSPNQRLNYNTGCPTCMNRVIRSGFNDLVTTHPNVAVQWHPLLNVKAPSEVSSGSSQLTWWVCESGHEWCAPVYSRRNHGCPTCASKKFVSKAEQSIFDYLAGLGLNPVQGDRSVLGGVELDVYVPEHGFAVEFNGLYWHSDVFRPETARMRHHAKWLAAKQAGIQLIQIWEDDWKRNPNLVKQMLAHKLGVSVQPKIFARRTVMTEVSTKEAQRFFEANHIQGFASGTHYLGLVERDIDNLKHVRALLVLKKEGANDLNIVRYATNANVVGGFTKLLTYAERVYTPDRFVTFADHTVSDGGLYEKHGFVADKELPPDYMYVVKGERKHKFGYRLKRFRNDPELQFAEGLTEQELAKLNGLPRIWDAGKTRYVKS